VATDIENELVFTYNREKEKASGPLVTAPRLENTGQIDPMLLVTAFKPDLPQDEKGRSMNIVPNAIRGR
jgi:hypothetical protein